MGWERSRKPRRRQMGAMILVGAGIWIAIAASVVMLIYLSMVLRTIKERNLGLQVLGYRGWSVKCCLVCVHKMDRALYFHKYSWKQEAIQAEQNLLASSKHKHQDAMKIAEANLQEVQLNVQHKRKVRDDLR